MRDPRHVGFLLIPAIFLAGCSGASERVPANATQRPSVAPLAASPSQVGQSPATGYKRLSEGPTAPRVKTITVSEGRRWSVAFCEAADQDGVESARDNLKATIDTVDAIEVMLFADQYVCPGVIPTKGAS